MRSAGSTNLRKHLEGKRLTQRQAIHAKCADCSGDYADGRLDCLIPECPLYPWMPYATQAAVSRLRRGRHTGDGAEVPETPAAPHSASKTPPPEGQSSPANAPDDVAPSN